MPPTLGVLTTGTELSTIRGHARGFDGMREAGDVTTGASPDAARAELLVEAMADLNARTSRYVQEPGDEAWQDLVTALARTHGDSEAYELLHAVEVRLRTSRRR
jgi:hypothetical protein